MTDTDPTDDRMDKASKLWGRNDTEQPENSGDQSKSKKTTGLGNKGEPGEPKPQGVWGNFKNKINPPKTPKENPPEPAGKTGDEAQPGVGPTPAPGTPQPAEETKDEAQPDPDPKPSGPEPVPETKEVEEGGGGQHSKETDEVHDKEVHDEEKNPDDEEKVVPEKPKTLRERWAEKREQRAQARAQHKGAGDQAEEDDEEPVEEEEDEDDPVERAAKFKKLVESRGGDDSNHDTQAKFETAKEYFSESQFKYHYKDAVESYLYLTGQISADEEIDINDISKYDCPKLRKYAAYLLYSDAKWAASLDGDDEVERVKGTFKEKLNGIHGPLKYDWDDETGDYGYWDYKTGGHVGGPTPEETADAAGDAAGATEDAEVAVDDAANNALGGPTPETPTPENPTPKEPTPEGAGAAKRTHDESKDLTAMSTVPSRHANEALKAMAEIAATNIGSTASKGWDLAQGLVKMTFTNPHALSSSGRAIGLAMGSLELAGDLADKAAKQYGINVDGNEPLKEDTLKYRLYMRAKKHGSEAVGNTFHAISRSLDGLGVDDIRQLTPDQLQQHLRDMQAEKDRLQKRIQDDDMARAKARGRWGGINNDALDVNLHPDEHNALSRDDRGLVMAQMNHLSKYMDGLSKQAKNLARQEADSKKLVKRADDAYRLKAQQFLGNGQPNPWNELLRRVDPNHKQDLDPDTGLPMSSSYVRKMINVASSIRQNKLDAGTLTDEEDAKYSGWIKDLTSYMDRIQQGQRQIPVKEFGEMWAHIARMHPNMKKYADNVARRGIWPSDKPTNIIKESIQNWINEKGPDTPEGQVGLMWLESLDRFVDFKSMNDFISRVNTKDLDSLKVYHSNAADKIHEDLIKVSKAIDEMSKTSPNNPDLKRLKAEKNWLQSQWMSERKVMAKMGGLTHQDIIRDNQMFNKEFQRYHAALVAQYRRDGTFNPDDPAVVRARNRLDSIERILAQKYNPPGAGLRGYSSKITGIGGGPKPKGMGPLGGGATGGKGAGSGGVWSYANGKPTYGAARNKLGVSVSDLFTEDELKDPANVETARTTLDDAFKKIETGDPTAMKEGYDALLQAKNIANDPERVRTILQDGAQKGIASYAVRLANDVLEKKKNGESVGSADIAGAQTYALYASLLEKDEDGSIAQMLKDLNVSQDMIDLVEKTKEEAGKTLQNSMAMGGDEARKAGPKYRKALLNAATKAVSDMRDDDSDADAENVFKLWESVKEYPALGEAYEALRSGENADMQMAQRFAAAFSEDGGFSKFYESIDPKTPEGQAQYARYGWDAQKEPGDEDDDSTLRNMTADNWANLIRDFDDFRTKQTEESKNPQSPYTKVPRDDHSKDAKMYSTVGDQFTRETLGTSEGAAAAHEIYSRNFVDDNDVRTNPRNAMVVAKLVKNKVNTQTDSRGRPADPRVVKRKERAAERSSLEDLLQSIEGGRGSDNAKIINRLLDANYAEEAADLITDMIASIDSATKEIEVYEPVLDADGKQVRNNRTKQPKTKLVKKTVKWDDAEKKQAEATLGQLRDYLQFVLAGECRKNAFMGADAEAWRKWKPAPWVKTDTDGNTSEVSMTGFRQDLVKMIKKEMANAAGSSKSVKNAYAKLIEDSMGGMGQKKTPVTPTETGAGASPTGKETPEVAPKTRTTKWTSLLDTLPQGDVRKALEDMTYQNKAYVRDAISRSAGDVKNPSNVYASTLFREYGVIDSGKTRPGRLNDMLSALDEMSAKIGDDPTEWPEAKKIIERKKELLQTRLMYRELGELSVEKKLTGDPVIGKYMKQLGSRIGELESDLFIHPDSQTISDISERKIPSDMEGLKAELKKKGVDLDATDSGQRKGAGKTYTNEQKAAQKAFNDAQGSGEGVMLEAEKTKRATDYIREVAKECNIELTEDGRFKSEEDMVTVSNKILEDTGWRGNDRMRNKVTNMTRPLWKQQKGGRKSYKEMREEPKKDESVYTNLKPQNVDELISKAVNEFKDFDYVKEELKNLDSGRSTPEDELKKMWGDALAKYANHDSLDALMGKWNSEAVEGFDPPNDNSYNDEAMDSLWALYDLVNAGISDKNEREADPYELNQTFNNLLLLKFGEKGEKMLDYWIENTKPEDEYEYEDEGEEI